MALKTMAQRQAEKEERERYSNPFSTVGPDTSKMLVIYARQSSIKQFVENVYSAEQQRDGLLTYARDTLHWQGPIKLLIENELATKTSGTLKTDARPGLIVVLEYVESGECSAVLAVEVDRLFRDESAIEAAVFVGTCKDNRVTVITLQSFYDFNHPTRKDTSRFIGKAMEAGIWVNDQIKGKALAGRTLKAEKGYVANGTCPVGMQLVQTGEKKKQVSLQASAHQPYLLKLYKRFFELSADLTALHNEIIGRPIFPELPDIDADSMRLTKVPGGWTVKNRSSLRHILCNPAYIGHAQFDGVIVKYNAWKAIIPVDLWEFAFYHLSSTNLDGTPIERPKREARYTREHSSDYGALLYGVRENGLPVIDGATSSQHVYVQVGKQSRTKERKASYTLKDFSQMNTSFYVASMDVNELDAVIEQLVKGLKSWQLEEAVAKVQDEKPISPLTRLQRTINETETAIKRIERRLATSEDVMTDKEVRQNYADKAKLTKQLEDLNKQQNQQSRSQAAIAQAKKDAVKAHEMWDKWDIDRKRRLVQILTESITLECVANGWLKLTIVWCDAFSVKHQRKNTVYLWRDSVRRWSTEETDTLTRLHGTVSRDVLLHALPTRSWQSIKDKASDMGLPTYRYGSHNLPETTSIQDSEVMTNLHLSQLTPDQRLWVKTESIQLDESS